MTAPLTKLLRKNYRWQWQEDQQRAFENLKDELSRTPALTCPDFSKPFVIQVDASNDGLGAALTQKYEGKERVIAYASRLLSDGEKKFTVTEKECLALVWAVRKFRPYIEGYKFIAITDHQALRWLMSLKQPSGRLARWMLELQQHNFEIEYRKGALNKVADALSRYPVDDYVEVTTLGVSDSEENKSTDDWHSKTLERVLRHPEVTGKFVVRQGNLYRKFQSPGRRDQTLEWKLCVPNYLRDKVLMETHDACTAGHLGMRKTLLRVKERYYWPGLPRDVKDYVRRCETCQRYKVNQAKTTGKMYFRRPKGPWYTVTADLIGPLPRSTKGNKYVLVIQDTFTKWVELAPLRDATAKLVVNSFKELILYRYGTPEVIITDNGPQFLSRMWSQLAADWGIEHCFTPPYTPQANPVERANRVLKTMISQYVKEDHKTWDRHLSEFRYAMNTAIHDSTLHTPAMLNFGRELRTPKAIHGALMVTTEDERETNDRETHSERMRNFRELYLKCQKNLKTAFEKQAKYYNLRRQSSPFVVGDRVWRRQHHLSTAVDSFSSKLAPKFSGPYTIKERLGPNVYVLVDEKNVSVGKAHAKDLKYVVQTVSEDDPDKNRRRTKYVRLPDGTQRRVNVKKLGLKPELRKS